MDHTDYKLRYWGEFLSRNNVKYRVDILSIGYSGAVQEVFFPAESPLVIEWSEADKLAPVRSSSATLTLISDKDRQFIDLYTDQIDFTRLDVYRSDVLYWSGYLNTELYEEPYSLANGYDVTLTFSDFAILDRLYWQLDDTILTVMDVVSSCLIGCLGSTPDSAWFDRMPINEIISTHLPDVATPMELWQIRVNTQNFFDDDGQPMTMREVLEGVLRPFALSIIQKNGQIYISDLNALFNLKTKPIVWDGADSNLSTDAVYNSVSVNFSPYADDYIFKSEVDEKPSNSPEQGGVLVYKDYHPDSLNYPEAEAFRFFHGDDYTANVDLGNAQFFQIRSIHSGSDETGVAAVMLHKDGGYNKDDLPKPDQWIINGNKPKPLDEKETSTPMIRLKPIFMPLSPAAFSSKWIKLEMSMLLDTRYCPFTDPGPYNEESNSALMERVRMIKIPVTIQLRDHSGQLITTFINSNEGDGGWYPATYPSTNLSCHLVFYDLDRDKKSACGGWKKNKRVLMNQGETIPPLTKDGMDGAIIGMPFLIKEIDGFKYQVPTSGWLNMSINEGFFQQGLYKSECQWFRWLLYKDISISICNKNGEAVYQYDTQDSAVINANAKEEYSIDTIIGTLPDAYIHPFAKGLIFDQDNRIINRFTRAGVTDRLERLLIGTVYSQYAGRKLVLSGTAKLEPQFTTLGDASTDGKFIVLSERQSCINDESEITMVQLSPDDFAGLEYN